MRFKVAICDDEKFGIDLVQSYLEHFNINTGVEFEISTYSNPYDLLANYNTPGAFDLLFLDMELSVNDLPVRGIDIAKTIRALPDNDVRIVFVSNYPKYMQLGYDVQASHYICKDIEIEQFDSIMNNIIAQYNKDTSFISIKCSRGEWVVLKLKDIIYIKSYPGKRDYVEYITKRKTYSEHRSILSLGESLYDNGFAFSNKYNLVNLIHLQRYTKDVIDLDNGVSLQLSRYYRKAFLDKFSENILSIT